MSVAGAASVVGAGILLWGAWRTGGGSTPPSLEGLLALDPAGVGRLELAAVNLACARGLPGTEGMDVEDCLKRLDEWAGHVESEVRRRRRSFVQRPGYYENSEAKFKAIQLVLALKEDYGVGYDPGRIGRPSQAELFDPAFFRDASGIFLCGPLGEARRGTCASLPVLVVAVGRRLGYPLRLAATKGHVFARWESPDGGERFNIEVAGRGVDLPADAHYRGWPFALSPAEEAQEGYLRSFGPAEEVALCLELRGACLAANGRHAESAAALEAALRLRPGSRNLRALAARQRALAGDEPAGG